MRVDREQRTNVPHIFAIGDLVGQPMLAHKATHEGKVAAEVAAGQKSAFDARVIPSVAYTDPEIAWVGLTETDAKAEGTPREGLVPLVRERSLARHGPRRRHDQAAVRSRDPSPAGRRHRRSQRRRPDLRDRRWRSRWAREAADLGLTVHPHPTLSETVAFAAEAFEGTLTDLYMPKRTRKSPS